MNITMEENQSLCSCNSLYNNTSDIMEGGVKYHLQSINRNDLLLSDGFIKWKGGKWRLKLVESRLVQTLLFNLRFDYYVHYFSKSYRNKLKQVLETYLTPEELANEKLVKDTVKDILACNKLIMATPYEYFFYNLRNKSKEERSLYVTDKYMLSKMSMTGKRRLHDVELNEKYNFYLLAKPFFKREVIQINSHTSFHDFLSMAKKLKRMIFKPASLGCGNGIFISDVCSADAAKKVFDKICSSKDNWVGEELIKQSIEMAQWNESSVNTVRLLSFSTPNGIQFVTSFFRTGRKGACVDNGGAGGVFAAIDVNTGTICTDGKDECTNTYETHPDSKIKFKGWKIPHWNELKDIATVLHSIVFPNMGYVGWDFALTDNGWVIIEGNWGQFIHQAALGHGLRPVFDKYIH